MSELQPEPDTVGIVKAHLRIAVTNGTIISVLVFLQGVLAGWGLASWASRRSFAATLIVASVLISGYIVIGYWRTEGVLNGGGTRKL